jgi:hypothetical protein
MNYNDLPGDPLGPADEEDDPGLIDEMVREGIQKELQKTDLTEEDRNAYEHALETLDEQNPEIHPA